MPTINVIGNTISLGSGSWDFGFGSDSGSFYADGHGQLGYAVMQAKLKAVGLADICKNPGMSAQNKMVTSSDDVESRWLAASEAFNQIKMAGLWGMYGAAFGPTGIRIIVDGKNWSGFKVVYADGASETWMVNPGNQLSSMKLFDSPLPDSKTSPTRPGCPS